MVKPDSPSMQEILKRGKSLKSPSLLKTGGFEALDVLKKVHEKQKKMFDYTVYAVYYWYVKLM